MGTTEAPPEGSSVHIRLKAGVSDPSLRAAHGVELSVPQSMGRKALRTLLHQLLTLSATPESPDFHFLAANEPLRTTLGKYLQRRGLSLETTLELTYYLPLPAPQPDGPHSVSDEWLSAIAATSGGGDDLVLVGSYSGAPSVLRGDTSVIDEATLRPVAHPAPIKAVAWLPSASHFVSASSDQTARLWAFDLQESAARPVATFRSDAAGTPVAFDSAAVSEASNPSAVLGGADGSVWVLPSLLTGEDTASEASPKPGVKRKSRDERAMSASRIGTAAPGLSVSSVQWKGEDVVTAGWDALVRQWDVETCSATVSIPCGGKPVTSVSVSDATLLVSAVDGAVRLVDARDGKGVVAACGKKGAHKGVVADGCWLAAGRSAVSGGLDGCLRFWDVRSMLSPAHVVENVHGAGGRCLAVCSLRKEGTYQICSAGSDGKVAVHRI